MVKCSNCGEETEPRYFEWSDEVLGRYCEKCNKSYDYETKEWEEGMIGSEYPWYGTNEWDDDWNEIEEEEE